MKYLIILLALSPTLSFASSCEAEVARIRNIRPARDISDSDYGKMLKGCPKKSTDAEIDQFLKERGAVRDYSHPILPDFDSLVDESRPSNNADLMKLELDAIERSRAADRVTMSALDTQISEMHAQQLETAREATALAAQPSPFSVQ